MQVARIQCSEDDLAERLREGKTTIAVCASDGIDDAVADQLNRASVETGIPALYYSCRGLDLQLGPLVIPRETACYECYSLRRQAALAPWERNLLASAEDAGRLECVLGVDWVVLDVIKFVTDIAEPIAKGRVLRIDYGTGLPEVHRVLHVPRCTVCGLRDRPARRLWAETAVG